jgi:hypothetical protein
VSDLLLQFVREYSSKVDELVKDKVAANLEKQAKSHEEKQAVAQAVSVHGAYPAFHIFNYSH